MRRLMLLALLLWMVPGCSSTTGTRLEGQSCFGTAECAAGLLCDTSQGTGICVLEGSLPPDAQVAPPVDAPPGETPAVDAAVPDAALPDAALPDAAPPDAMM